MVVFLNEIPPYDGKIIAQLNSNKENVNNTKCLSKLNQPKIGKFLSLYI